MRVHVDECVCVCNEKKSHNKRFVNSHKLHSSSAAAATLAASSAALPTHLESDPNGISGVVSPVGYARRPEFTLSLLGT